MTAITGFAGRVAVVTGGGSGIGLAMAKAFVAEGAQLVIADMEQDVLDQAASDIGATGLWGDVASAQSAAVLTTAVVEWFGEVDILCNNAGVAPKVWLARGIFQ